MQERLLDLLKRSKPLFGPISKDAVNLRRVLSLHSSSMQTGVYVLQSLSETWYVPMVDGELLGSLDKEFDLLSFYKTTRNFLVRSLGLQTPPEMPLQRSETLWVNLESTNFNLRELFRKLRDFHITGFLEVEDRVRKSRGYIFLQEGIPVDARVGNKKGEDAVIEIVNSLSESVCLMSFYQLDHIILSFLLSQHKLWSVYRDIESAEIFISNVLKNNPQLFLLLVSVDINDYGYRIYSRGEEIYTSNFVEDAPIFEVYALRDFKTFEFINVEDYIEKNEEIKGLGVKGISSGIIYFCPACWNGISEEDIVCPYCGYDLIDFHHMPYEYKLLMGLEHPNTKMKLKIIHIVGMKNLKEAIPQLEHMISKESNPIVLVQIVDALARMTHPEALELLLKLALHRYPLVRSKAMQALAKLSKLKGIL